MSIVWPCTISVECYLAAGREIEVARPDCPACLSLVRAVPDRASRGWRGVNQTPADIRLLQRIRGELTGGGSEGGG